jgi:hypothetical protein
LWFRMFYPGKWTMYPSSIIHHQSTNTPRQMF